MSFNVSMCVWKNYPECSSGYFLFTSNSIFRFIHDSQQLNWHQSDAFKTQRWTSGVCVSGVQRGGESLHLLLSNALLLFTFSLISQHHRPPLGGLSCLSAPAASHLNISSSCLAASAARQVSSRSEDPTLKWSMEGLFSVCVRADGRLKAKGREPETPLHQALRHRPLIGSEKVEKTWSDN